MNSSAARVVEKCGGPGAVAKMVGVHVTRVHRWTYPKARGGSDGVIPAKHHATILREARALGIGLDPSDFFDVEPTHEIAADHPQAPASVEAA